MNRKAVLVDHDVPRSAPRSDPAPRLTIEEKRDLDLAPDDRAALDRLIEERPEAGVFVSTAWLSGFFADPPPGVEPSLIILRDNGRLRGIVPLAVRQGATARHVGLLGGGFGSDRVDLLAARGFEAACADAWLSWVVETSGNRAFALELRDVPVESPLWGALHRLNAERDWRLALQPRDVQPLPWLDLPEMYSAAALAGRPPHGSSIDKHRRWLSRRGAVSVQLLTDLDEIMDAFDTLCRLLHARWTASAIESALDSPRLSRLHRHALPLLRRDGLLRLMRVSVDGRTVGVFYGVAAGGWWGYCLAGYDREWAGRIHLGRLVVAAAIDAAAQEGATAFDFLKGAERYKYLWPVRARATLDADTYSAHAGAQWSRAAASARDAARALARSVVTCVRGQR